MSQADEHICINYDHLSKLYWLMKKMICTYIKTRVVGTTRCHVLPDAGASAQPQM